MNNTLYKLKCEIVFIQDLRDACLRQGKMGMVRSFNKRLKTLSMLEKAYKQLDKKVSHG